ncbi:MAG TPA: glutamate synthase subunit beta [Acidimicrobiales bacterium]|nr:glutamate synthase subunit beta [Acidimicrobiales bacterium]
MADPRGFMRIGRTGPTRRPINERIYDWREVYNPFPKEELRHQAARCMDCGIPFCHEGCPLGNLIPEWNDLVWRSKMPEASDRLHATNNFPEFTGRLCPAPCEGSCVLGINDDPVLIKQVEYEIAEWAGESGLVPQAVAPPTGHSVAVVGSGPAGLAVAQQLTRAGHSVVVFERGERIGGLMRFGVPEFKMEKSVIDRRVAQMESEGTVFKTSTTVEFSGPNGAVAPDATVVSVATLEEEFDAIVLAIGSTRPRDLSLPGRDLDGVLFAMDYLKGANLVCEGLLSEPLITAQGRHVVIIGGGDTGADCLGTAHRQGAASVLQLEILPEPPDSRTDANPWPTWPLILRTSAAHEEGGERIYSVSTRSFLDDGDGRVSGLLIEEIMLGSEGFESVPGTEKTIPADLVLLALGFVGPERDGVVRAVGCELNERDHLKIDQEYMTSKNGVFGCGDAVRGQSLIVWAIAEGRSCAASVDRFIMGSTDLPSPLNPYTYAIS